jgi:hypothetical protein
MPKKIIDFSARSEIIREEPYHLHFWESTPAEALDFLRDPRSQLESMGIRIPDDCRVETVIENHDWIAANTGRLEASNGDVIVCNVGGGNVGRAVYRVTMYGHDESAIGRFEKELLHSPDEQFRGAG